jgi:hypothetical protein
MNEEKREEQRAYSYEEYQRTFYPSSSQERIKQDDTPSQIGARMAREHIKKIRDTRQSEAR